MKPMLASQFDKSRVQFPCLVQPKYDGVRCLMLIGDDKDVHLISRGGKEYDVPKLKAWGVRHKWMLPLDGEIYVHKELTFQQICSAVKCKTELTDKLRFVVYDRPRLGDNDKRWMGLMCDFEHVVSNEAYLSNWKVCYSFDEINAYHDECVKQGYEGAIIRNLKGKYIEGRSGDLMKLKKMDTDEYVIIDVIEASGKDAGTALFRFRCNGIECAARPVGDMELRRKYLQDKWSIIGKMCTIRHQGFTDAGIPRFPVALAIRDYE